MFRKSTAISDLICSECGTVSSIPRYKNDRRERYHIKDVYCPKCNKTTKFIEIGDIDLYKKELEFKVNLNEKEQMILDLLSIDNNQRIR